MISPEAKKVLSALVRRWREASDAESDPEEHRAFAAPIRLVERAILLDTATHEDIRTAIPVCTPYPNWGRSALVEIADAERDGRRITFITREDGAFRWEVDPAGPPADAT